MRVELTNSGSRALVFLPSVDAATGRALADAVRALPDHLTELVLILEQDARVQDEAVATLTRVWRGLMRRQVRTVLVSNRALQRDLGRRVIAEVGDTRSTVTVSQAIAEEWLGHKRRRRRPGSDTLTQMEAVQTRMKSLRDSVDG